MPIDDRRSTIDDGLQPFPVAPDIKTVIWFLERPGERLQCEIRQADEAGYELVWSDADGRFHVERSLDPEELMHRRRALENWLRLDGWVRPGRVVLRSRL